MPSAPLPQVLLLDNYRLIVVKEPKHTDSIKKPPIPSKDEVPIMGLKSEKNYIVTNAVENILAAPKNVRQEPKRFTEKKTYGKVPEYLNKIKKEIDEEYKVVREMQMQEEELKEREKFVLSEEEKKELVNGLKKKWEVLNHEYQGIITKVAKTNPLGLVTLKEKLEREMTQIEKDIEKLSKKQIIIDASR